MDALERYHSYIYFVIGENEYDDRLLTIVVCCRVTEENRPEIQ